MLVTLIKKKKFVGDLSIRYEFIGKSNYFRLARILIFLDCMLLAGELLLLLFCFLQCLHIPSRFRKRSSELENLLYRPLCV